jgi:hypothetical protein
LPELRARLEDLRFLIPLRIRPEGFDGVGERAAEFPQFE